MRRVPGLSTPYLPLGSPSGLRCAFRTSVLTWAWTPASPSHPALAPNHSNSSRNDFLIFKLGLDMPLLKALCSQVKVTSRAWPQPHSASSPAAWPQVPAAGTRGSRPPFRAGLSGNRALVTLLSCVRALPASLCLAGTTFSFTLPQSSHFRGRLSPSRLAGRALVSTSVSVPPTPCPQSRWRELSCEPVWFRTVGPTRHCDPSGSAEPRDPAQPGREQAVCTCSLGPTVRWRGRGRGPGLSGAGSSPGLATLPPRSQDESGDDYSELEDTGRLWLTFVALFLVTLLYGGFVTFIKVGWSRQPAPRVQGSCGNRPGPLSPAGRLPSLHPQPLA